MTANPAVTCRDEFADGGETNPQLFGEETPSTEELHQHDTGVVPAPLPRQDEGDRISTEQVWDNVGGSSKRQKRSSLPCTQYEFDTAFVSDDDSNC